MFAIGKSKSGLISETKCFKNRGLLVFLDRLLHHRDAVYPWEGGTGLSLGT